MRAAAVLPAPAVLIAVSVVLIGRCLADIAILALGAAPTLAIFAETALFKASARFPARRR